LDEWRVTCVRPSTPAWQGAKHGEGANDQSLFTSVALDAAGTRWAPPRRLPGGGSGGGAGGGAGGAAQVGARWGPVLFQPPSGGPLHLFYSEGVTCYFCRDPRCRSGMMKAGGGSGGASGAPPPVWRAGGTIFVVTSSTDGATWGPRRVVLAQSHEGQGLPDVRLPCHLIDSSHAVRTLVYRVGRHPMTWRAASGRP